MIALIDYGMGNIASIQNMFKRIGNKNVILTKDAQEIDQAEKIILPGVGAFGNGMQNLHNSQLIDVLRKKAFEDKSPILGICLGMQLLTRGSEEGNMKGLGFLNADTKKFVFDDSSNLKVPHMGWNYLRQKKQSELINNHTKQKFYFVHSYYVKCDDAEDVIATCQHGIEFDCVVNHENIFGAQFHPEKSHKFGMELFDNFSKL